MITTPITHCNVASFNTHLNEYLNEVNEQEATPLLLSGQGEYDCMCCCICVFLPTLCILLHRLYCTPPSLSHQLAMPRGRGSSRSTSDRGRAAPYGTRSGGGPPPVIPATSASPTTTTSSQRVGDMSLDDLLAMIRAVVHSSTSTSATTSSSSTVTGSSIQPATSQVPRLPTAPGRTSAGMYCIVVVCTAVTYNQMIVLCS